MVVRRSVDLLIQIMPWVLALLTVGPGAWLLFFDLVPPQVRHSGYITAHDPRGYEYDDSNQMPRIGGDFDVHWKSSPHTRDCPGEVQVEISQGPAIWPVMKRFAANPPIGVREFTPEPWPAPDYAKPNVNTLYRVTTFWDCNWLQKTIPGYSIVEQGPDLYFYFLPKIEGGISK